MELEDGPRGNQAQSQSPTRPGSAWTSNSLFADSAISLRTSTPKPLDDESNTTECSEPVAYLSNRLRGLVSEIWESEQDGALGGSKRRRIETAMDNIEAVIAEDDNAAYQDEQDDNQTTRSTNPEGTILPEELDLIRNNLSLTINSMRMRQQEQSHLHELTMEKLEAVAQRCVQQETRLREFSDEIILLKERNRQLTRENVTLSDQLQHSRAESRKRDDAVHAMSSAVAGLSGWINSTSPPIQSSRKIVVRGRGDFAGVIMLTNRMKVQQYLGLMPSLMLGQFMRVSTPGSEVSATLNKNWTLLQRILRLVRSRPKIALEDSKRMNGVNSRPFRGHNLRSLPTVCFQPLCDINAEAIPRCVGCDMCAQ